MSFFKPKEKTIEQTVQDLCQSLHTSALHGGGEYSNVFNDNGGVFKTKINNLDISIVSKGSYGRTPVIEFKDSTGAVVMKVNTMHESGENFSYIHVSPTDYRLSSSDKLAAHEEVFKKYNMKDVCENLFKEIKDKSLAITAEHSPQVEATGIKNVLNRIEKIKNDLYGNNQATATHKNKL